MHCFQNLTTVIGSEAAESVSSYSIIIEFLSIISLQIFISFLGYFTYIFILPAN